MKKVVLSLALVAMMFVSCKEAEAQVEEVATEVEATTEEAVEAVEVAADSIVEVATEEVAQ